MNDNIFSKDTMMKISSEADLESIAGGVSADYEATENADETVFHLKIGNLYVNGGSNAKADTPLKDKKRFFIF